MYYKVRPIDRTTGEEVLPDRRTISEAGARLGTTESATTARNRDLNILSIENPIESKVLLTTEESSTWLLDSGAS